jgi:acetate kinase
MKVLVLNCGSSTLKFKVYEMDTNIPNGQGRRLARGVIEKIGG